jgi:hypothetical protein
MGPSRTIADYEEGKSVSTALTPNADAPLFRPTHSHRRLLLLGWFMAVGIRIRS